MATTRPFTRSEVKAILKSEEISLRDSTLISMMCNSGYRISEVLSIRIKDVAVLLKNGTLKVLTVVTVNKQNMKGSKIGRSCKLNSDVRKILKLHIDDLLAKGGSLKDDALFSGRKGFKSKAITRVSGFRIVKAAAELILGVSQNLACHSCRKLFAQALYEKTSDILLVSKALFHRHVTTTQAYLSSGGAMTDLIEGLI